MQWEKLEHSYQAMEALLRSLRPTDRFNVLLFNTELNWFEKQPVSADKPTVERALEFVRASRLRGGTDLQQALAAALEQAKGSSGESYLILLSDGDATRGLIGTGRLAAWYSRAVEGLGSRSRVPAPMPSGSATTPIRRSCACSAVIAVSRNGSARRSRWISS